MRLALLMSCASAPEVDPVEQALAAGADLAECDALAFEEMAVLCRVRVAAHAASRGDDPLATLACEGIAEGMWREECHFRAGEELARLGLSPRALAHCAQAGDFAPFCLTHVAWGMPPLREVDAGDPPHRIAATLREFEDTVSLSLQALPPAVRADGVAALRARAWFHLLYGRGEAAREAARSAPEGQGADAITAWAFELARLGLRAGRSPQAIVEGAVAAWSGELMPPTGPPLDPEERLGRHTSAVLPEGVEGLPHAPLFGGGRRLVGEDLAEDLTIATLEGLFFDEAVAAEAFAPWLGDPRPRVRWTATKLYVLAGGAEDDPDLADRFEDPVQRGYVGLSRRGGRPGRQAPRPKGPQGPDPRLGQP